MTRASEIIWWDMNNFQKYLYKEILLLHTKETQTHEIIDKSQKYSVSNLNINVSNESNNKTIKCKFCEERNHFSNTCKKYTDLKETSENKIFESLL